MEVVYFLVGLVVFIIQIIVLVKFFQIASDIRAIKKNQVSEKPKNTSNLSIPEPNVILDVFDDEEINSRCKGATYCIKGNDVEFSDGFKGQIIRYLNSPKCSIITDDKFELLYNDIYYAVAALHIYLQNKTESKEGFYEKKKYIK